ncbi:hypothetical protein C9374_010043 [Naegleria lovaniensis]|uniref:HECT domain-containing protein n=1 Tax=Naegleria lovaniensis TaxID=51637 RepID=A0AA88GGU9_NAELO|nr:uncharacterized protein C9374_010043 [Naegleria lovaniensis]KAG2375039.1 hypothetical protein C9374_010043 [Naegleria lovaniensis]
MINNFRRLFHSSTTDDDLLHTLDDFDRANNNTPRSVTSGSTNDEQQQLVSNSTSLQKSSDLEFLENSNTTSTATDCSQQHNYYEIFNKISHHKTHLNKVMSISVDHRHKNNIYYTTAMDGVACRWKLVELVKNRMSAQIELPSSSLTSSSSFSFPNMEDLSNLLELDFMYERQTGAVLSHCLFHEFLLTGSDDHFLTLFYIHNEKPMTRIKCNDVVTSIFAFDYLANDFNIVGSVLVGLRNGELNMFSILKQYSKLGKWTGVALIPNETFNRNHTPRHARQINFMTICPSKEVLENYVMNQSQVPSALSILTSTTSGQQGTAGSGGVANHSQQTLSHHSNTTSSTGHSNNVSTHNNNNNHSINASTPEIDYSTVKSNGGPYSDPFLIVSAANDCFVKIWSPSTGDLLFLKEFDSPCTKVITTSFRRDSVRHRFFFVSHYNDLSIFTVNTKSKYATDFRVHYNINQFFLHQFSEFIDKNLNDSSTTTTTSSSTSSTKTEKSQKVKTQSSHSAATSRRDRGYSTALSVKENSQTSSNTSSTTVHNNNKSTSVHTLNEIPVSKNGYIYLIGWNSMQARLEIWLYNLFDQKAKPTSQYQQKLQGVTFLQNLTLDRSSVVQERTDLITTFSVVYSTFKKTSVKKLILRKSLIEASSMDTTSLLVSSSNNTVTIVKTQSPSSPKTPPTALKIMPQLYCNAEFRDLYHMATTKRAAEMRNPVKIAQLIQNFSKELSEIGSIDAKLTFLQQLYTNSNNHSPDSKFNFIFNISHTILCDDQELVQKSKRALSQLNQEVLTSRKSTSLHKKFMYIREVSLKMGETKLTVLNYDHYISFLKDFCNEEGIHKLIHVQVSSSSARKIAILVQDVIKTFFKPVKTCRHSYKYHLKPFHEIRNYEKWLSNLGCEKFQDIYIGLGRMMGFMMLQPYLFVEDFFPTRVVVKTILGHAIQFCDFSDFGVEYSVLKQVIEKRHDGTKTLEQVIHEISRDEFYENLLFNNEHWKKKEFWKSLMQSNRVTEDNKVTLVQQVVSYLLFSNISQELQCLLKGLYQFLPSLDCIRELLDEMELTCLLTGTKLIHSDFVIFNNHPPSTTTQNSTQQQQVPSNQAHSNTSFTDPQLGSSIETDPCMAWLWEFIYDDMDASIVADNLKTCLLSKKSLSLKNDLMYYTPIPIICRDDQLKEDIQFNAEEHEMRIGTFQNKQKFFECLLYHIEQNASRRSTVSGSGVSSPRTPLLMSPSTQPLNLPPVAVNSSHIPTPDIFDTPHAAVADTTSAPTTTTTTNEPLKLMIGGDSTTSLISTSVDTTGSEDSTYSDLSNK